MNVLPASSSIQEVPSFTELVTYSSDHAKLNLQLMRNVSETDALEAVKLDPAVLEAQVTIGKTRMASSSVAESTATEPDRAVTDSKPVSECSSRVASFERAVMMSKAALLSLTPDQYDLLMKYAATLRSQRLYNQIHLECAFCKNNGESLSWYTSHALKSWRGRVICPVLRAYRCPRCGATGDRAHTLKYCPDNSYIDIFSGSF